MSCLALSLQPSNGRDILVQTREWFPPYRALVATSAFRQTRLALAAAKNQSANRPSVEDDPAKADFISSLGDDPLAASSGQLIVGAESRYRVVYRLVNGIYVLGVTVADHDNSVNVFECIHIVNQAVSVIVAACRGVDVTPEKLNKKYAEIYMALDIVLRGVSNIRLAAMLSSMHGDGIAKMVHSAVDTESKIRGADSWASVEVQAVDHQATVDVFSSVRLELPAETIAAGDEARRKLAPLTSVQQDQKQEKGEELASVKDPFAASDLINTQEELVVEFKKDSSPAADLSVALAGLEVTPLPPAEATMATRVSVEGFEGDYGGIEFSNEQASLGETFEGFSEAWGGGLDASEFVGPKDIKKKQGLGGLELLETGVSCTEGGIPMEAKNEKASAGAVENLLVQKTETKGPEIYVVEEVRAEFRESLLARAGLMGVIYLRNAQPSKPTADQKETDLSFRLDNTSTIKRCAMHGSKISSVGSGLFHVRAGFSDEPIPILKYSLLPRLTPLPLRVRLVQRLSGTLLSVMVQYVSNPDLPAPLVDVTFVLKLPVDPSLLKVAPRAVLNRADRELKWHVPEIPLMGFPGCMRARMPLDSSSPEDLNAIEISGSVKFSMQGSNSLSGVSILPAAEGNRDFVQGSHKYVSGHYIYN